MEIAFDVKSGMKLTFDIIPVVKKATLFTHRGIAYTPSATRQFQAKLRRQAKELWRSPPLEGALQVVWHFYLPIKNKKRWGEYCYHRPDQSNLQKSAEDALNGVVWGDDGQIVDGRGIKRYAEKGRIDVYIYPVEKNN